MRVDASPRDRGDRLHGTVEISILYVVPSRQRLSDPGQRVGEETYNVKLRLLSGEELLVARPNYFTRNKNGIATFSELLL